MQVTLKESIEIVLDPTLKIDIVNKLFAIEILQQMYLNLDREKLEISVESYNDFFLIKFGLLAGMIRNEYACTIYFSKSLSLFDRTIIDYYAPRKHMGDFIADIVYLKNSEEFELTKEQFFKIKRYLARYEA